MPIVLLTDVYVMPSQNLWTVASDQYIDDNFRLEYVLGAATVSN